MWYCLNRLLVYPITWRNDHLILTALTQGSFSLSWFSEQFSQTYSKYRTSEFMKLFEWFIKSHQTLLVPFYALKEPVHKRHLTDHPLLLCVVHKDYLKERQVFLPLFCNTCFLSHNANLKFLKYGIWQNMAKNTDASIITTLNALLWH